MDNQEDAERRRNVLVVFGRNTDARLAMFEFLRSIGLNPIEWNRARALTGEATPYIGTILDAAFRIAQAVVVLFTPDEIVSLRPEYADGMSDPDLNPPLKHVPMSYSKRAWPWGGMRTERFWSNWGEHGVSVT
jgi:hypothetical protein